MAMNEGKIFEADWKKSVPDETNCVYERLPDPPQAFTQSAATRFSNNNPYDNILFRDGTYYALELKSTKGTSISLPDNEDDKKKMIKPHQIKGLTRISKTKGTVAGFIFNFRESKLGDNRTYFMHILDFNKFLEEKEPTKKSINEKDIMSYGYILIENNLKRVHYTYDVDKFLTMTKR
jgi:penicillin-binding protein-related factor A (putative recombinase)